MQPGRGRGPCDGAARPAHGRPCFLLSPSRLLPTSSLGRSSAWLLSRMLRGNRPQGGGERVSAVESVSMETNESRGKR